jgi:very-short-patch-repair endonuclease
MEARGSHQDIPVTTPVVTMLDLAASLSRRQLERAIAEADRLDLISPGELWEAIPRLAGRRGLPALRKALQPDIFTLTDSELERLFLPIARQAGLPRPKTRQMVNDFRVDFYWPGLNLVVETDGLRYHRTAAQQTKDRLRDQAHLMAGCTQLRFTHAQVSKEPAYVERTLRLVATRLRP